LITVFLNIRQNDSTMMDQNIKWNIVSVLYLHFYHAIVLYNQALHIRGTETCQD